MSKIGVAVITCNREEMYKGCIESIQSDWYDELVTVNDGNTVACDKGEYIETSGGEGVGCAKNTAMQYLLKMDCDYIILVEDDMVFTGNLFAEYIKAYKETGIQHFMFGYHGPANKGGVSGGKPTPRTKVLYTADTIIALNQHCVGAVTFYTKAALEKVGLHDESFINAFEHVEHSYRLAKAKFCPAYWWWPDIHNSLEFVREQKCSEESSAIRPLSSWQSNIQAAFTTFSNKHGVSPVQIPDTSFEDICKNLKEIFNERPNQ